MPLDRSGAVPGRVSLLVKRVRARRRGGATRPPLFVLAGGPGQSATEAFGPDSLGVLFPAYRNRDLVIFDQRGSGRLRTAALPPPGAGEPAEGRSGRGRVRAAPRRAPGLLHEPRLGRRHRRDPRAAGSRAGRALRDVVRHQARARVRAALPAAGGAARARLHGRGGRPGSLLPRHLRRRAARAGIALPEALPLDERPGRRPRGARGAPGARAAARAGGGPARTDAGTPPHARGRLLDPARRRLRPSAARRLPRRRARRPQRRRHAAAAASQARVRGGRGAAATATAQLRPLRGHHMRGDPASLGAHDAAGPRRAAAPGRRAWPRQSRTPSSSHSTGPPSLASDTLNLCERWPQSPLAPEFGPGPLPDVPVLLLEGEDDLRTPVENARRVAELFPRSSLVVAPATGHSALGSDFSGCTDRAFARFFQERSVPERCPRGRRFFLPSPPPPRRLSSVSPLAGTSGLRGRTLAAVRLTLRDVAEDSITELILDLDDPDLARGGGLRAGHYRIDADNTLELDGVAFVPGVTLSGRLEHFGERRQRGRLRVSGRAAARGLLRVERLRRPRTARRPPGAREPERAGGGQRPGCAAPGVAGCGGEPVARASARRYTTSSPPRSGANTIARRTRRSGARARRPDVEPLHELAQHHLDLELGEARTEAAPHAAAERDPGVGAGRRLEEALGPEGARVWVDVRAPVHQVDARRNVHARRQQPPADLHRLREAAQHQRDHGTEAKGLLDDRIEVGVLACVDLVAQPARARRDAAPAPRAPTRAPWRWSRGRPRAAS